MVVYPIRRTNNMKTSLKLIPVICAILLLAACGEKKKTTPKESFWHVLSFIGSQVAQVDTSVYSIRKYVYVDSLRTDTEYIHRDRFKEVAKDFLTLPDIAKPEYQDRYVEETRFDETLNRVMISYLPVKPENEEIQRQELLIKPDPSGDKITSIYITTVINTKDSIVEKKLLWKVDESFQVTTTRQLPQQPEQTTTYKVAWNEDEPDQSAEEVKVEETPANQKTAPEKKEKDTPKKKAAAAAPAKE